MQASQVTTFYSYKGGSGRSMTLANVAWALATNGEKVLVIDWDLEAPGLHRYFHPFLADPEQKNARGLIDRVWEYLDELSVAPSERSSRFKLADCRDLVQTLDIPDLPRGYLHFIGAGRQDDNYSAKVVGLDWNAFYQRFDGETFINALIEWGRKHYTHILIDSRTGVADTAGICTTQLPDTLVFCLVYNRQSIDGSASVARSILQSRAEMTRKELKLQFVPCRVEDRGTVEAARRYTTLKLGAVVREDRNQLEKNLRRAEIRHYPWCAFEEKLAVFEELPEERGSLLEVVHDLALRISPSKKNLNIKAYEPEVLASYWRRVAFDDPRLIDLATISEEGADDAWRRLYLWLREANNNETLRPDWLIALAEHSLDFVARRGLKLTVDDREFAGRVAESSARRAFQADPDYYGARLALVLYARSAQYLEAGQLIQASAAIREAIALLQGEDSPTLRWRLARALERSGDVLTARDNHAGALEAYQLALATYEERNRRVSIAGTEFDVVRALRLSARAYTQLGHFGEADMSIKGAARILLTVPTTAIERDASEAVLVLKARIRIGAEIEGDEFDETCHWVRQAAQKLLAPTARSEVDLHIVLARAARLAKAAKRHEALDLLDGAPPEFLWDASLVALRLRILIDNGQAEKALEYLAVAVGERRVAMVPELMDLARELLVKSGDTSRLAELLASWMTRGDAVEDRVLLPLVRNVLAHSSASNDLDNMKLINLLELLTRKRD